MGSLSKIGMFLVEAFKGPEAKINAMSRAVAKAGRPGLSEGEALEILKEAAARAFTPQVQVQVFRKKLREAGHRIDRRQEADLYTVALCNSILNLLGEDTMVHGPGGDPERMRKLCEAQRARLNEARLDQEALRESLRQSLEIKTAWKASGHPGLEVCRITAAESQAPSSFRDPA